MQYNTAKSFFPPPPAKKHSSKLPSSLAKLKLKKTDLKLKHKQKMFLNCFCVLNFPLAITFIFSNLVRKGDLVWMGINLSSIYFSLFCCKHTHTHTRNEYNATPILESGIVFLIWQESHLLQYILNAFNFCHLKPEFKLRTFQGDFIHWSNKQQCRFHCCQNSGSDKSRLKKCCQIISSKHYLSHFKY